MLGGGRGDWQTRKSIRFTITSVVHKGGDHFEQLTPKSLASVVRSLAVEAGLGDIDSFARSWHILMKGSIVSAAEGDAEAAQRAKTMARALIDQHRQRLAGPPTYVVNG